MQWSVVLMVGLVQMTKHIDYYFNSEHHKDRYSNVSGIQIPTG